jgi:tetratricopeptide (TPR) repeat protein
MPANPTSPPPASGGPREPSGPGHPSSMSALLEELARAPEQEVVDSLQPGAVVGDRFEILREIGRGGFGLVFEARDRELNRHVAVKTVRPRRGMDAAALRDEAEAAAQLHHPNIVTIHDVGRSGGEGWIVLELLRGETLEERMRRGALPLDEALRVATDVARGLSHAHRSGVIHRDLKPSNVFLCDDGAVKILDFGLSRFFGSSSGKEGGTPAYMAPEQWRREKEDERTDVFALGVMLHEMVAGSRPYAVEGGRSGALDAGPAPALPASAAPRPVRHLVAAMAARAPADRPRDGTAALESLLRVRSAKEQRRLLRHGGAVALAGAAVVAMALAAWRLIPSAEVAPGDRIPVAVADFQNGTSDPELNGLSGMLTTSLEQSRRLTVLTRSRLVDVLRQMGQEPPERLDEPLAREVGRQAGVKALLLATVHRFDDLYAIELRALDPARNEYLFTLKEEGTGKSSVPGMIDRLSRETRERLRERPADVAAARRSVADVTTGNLAAYEHYFKARQALDLRQFDRTRTELQAALKIDPEFALAHYQIAVLDAWTVKPGLSDEPSVRSAREHLDTAVKLADRLPDKERLALLAWKATWERHPEEARRLRDQAADAYPQDKEAVFWAGDIRFHSGDTPAAIPFFERALRLDPEYRLVQEHLVLALSAVDRRSEQLEWARRWAESSREPQAYRALGRALLANGRRDEAAEAFRQASARDGLFAVSPAMAAHLSFHGRAHEAEAQLRSALASLPPPKAGAPDDSQDYGPRLERVSLTKGLVDALVYQGRLREARTFLQGLESLGLPPRDCAGIRLGFAFATHSPEDVRAAVRALETAGALKDGGTQLEAALALAVAGDVAASRPLADAAFASPAASEFPGFVRPFYEAIVAWRTGKLEEAEVGLRAVAEGPYLDPRYKALSILGEVEVARGRYGPAVEALERARAIPFAPQIGGLPYLQANGLHRLAVAYDRLGEPARARQRVEELLRLWQRADPDAPNVAEARALARKLGAQAAAGPAGR